MFIHNFLYSLKTLFRNKSLIFWTYAFPLILGSFFYLAFSNITDSEKLDIIDIAIVNNEEFLNNEPFRETLKNLGDEDNDERLFNIKYVTEEEAASLLDEEEVIGYLKLEDDKKNLVFTNNGIDQTVFKYVVEEITETTKIMENLMNKRVEEEFASGKKDIDYEALSKEIYDKLKEDNAFLEDKSSSHLDYVMIEFYTLISMTCMYGGIISMVSINQKLANMDKKGQRIAVSPAHKLTLITSSLLASYIVQLIGIALLFIYTLFILKVDYGSNILYVILLSLAGSLAGLSLGIAIASLFKANENTKTGIMLAVTMFGCFLSGMFGITMKYVVDKNLPIINKINPVSMITDGLYSLYYYDTFNRYYINLISLLVFSSTLIVISIIGLRRQKYDSI